MYRRTLLASLTSLAIGCTATSPVDLDPDEAGSGDGKADTTFGLPDVRCAGHPDAGARAEGFKHWTSAGIALAATAHHRGFDLVAAASSATQTLGGWISYGLVDKALEDEAVEVFACRAGQWQRLGTTRTDDEGHFELHLSGRSRLPVGMRDLYVSVKGDRTGAGFLAVVAPDTTPLLVSDIDGTLTSSESAFLKTTLLGLDVDVRAGAPAAYRAAAAKGYQLVYVTARGNQNTEVTRDWLARKGFPRGPVRLAPTFVTLPGSDTVAYKSTTFDALGAELEIAAGVGNRATDIAAYAATGVTAARIYIEAPEFADEVKPEIAAGHAVGFDTYDQLRARFATEL